MYCKKCGKEMAAGTTFCPHCGQSVQNEAPEEEKVFTAKQNAGLMAKALAAGGGIGTFLFGFAYTQLPWYASSNEKIILLGAAVIAFVLCVCNIADCVSRNKVKLCISAQKIHGVTVNGFQTKTFEYTYSDISDVGCTFGTVTIRVNGRWQAIPGLENAEQAKELIAQKISPKAGK